MDGENAGKTNLLTNKGSVFDLVAMFVLLIGGDRSFANNLFGLFNEYLDNGYTYKDIQTEIITSFYDKKHTFRWHLFSNKKSGNDINILKSGTRYYHKQLKLVSGPSIVEHDINRGTMVSRTPEYFLEPTASYTVQDFIQYFYNIMPVDLQSQHPSRMTGILKYKIDTYGIDKLLFMTDLFAEYCIANNSIFILGQWDDYAMKADERISEIKSALPENEPYYTPKNRRLFDV